MEQVSTVSPDPLAQGGSVGGEVLLLDLQGGGTLVQVRRGHEHVAPAKGGIAGA